MSVIVADTLKARVAGAAVTTTGGLNVGGATTVAAAVVATSFAGDGSSITALSGSNISSGTVAAAMEATLFGIPAIALSQDMNEEDHRDLSQNTKRIYSAAQGYAAQVIMKVTQVAWQKDILINVNFPAVLSKDVRGIEVTREGRSNKLSDEIIEHRDPRDKRYYWIGQRRGGTKHPVGTDINAIERNTISVTPISMNLTHKPTIKILKGVFGSD